MFFEAKKNINWLRKNFGNKLLIGLENNNYYPTKPMTLSQMVIL